MKIDANGMHFSALNERVRDCEEREIYIANCVGQRYIGTGLSDKEIAVGGTPGNALGAYLNGARIRVYGNVQEATGDTMNGGQIVVGGSAGDATGYAMRGGKIFIRGDAGYRCGIHMKAYKENKPATPSSSAAERGASSASTRRAAPSSCSGTIPTASRLSAISAARVCTAAKFTCAAGKFRQSSPHRCAPKKSNVSPRTRRSWCASGAGSSGRKRVPL